jgi:hypothetical protein
MSPAATIETVTFGWRVDTGTAAVVGPEVGILAGSPVDEAAGVAEAPKTKVVGEGSVSIPAVLGDSLAASPGLGLLTAGEPQAPATARTMPTAATR